MVAMKKYYFPVLLMVLIIMAPAGARGQAVSGSKEPIAIVSDRFDIYSEKKIAVFSGNVVVTQSDTVIKSDEFHLYYKKEGTPGKETSTVLNPGAIESGNIERIEAKGHVIITQKKKVVTGDKAIFYNDQQKVIITGNPMMKDGDNEIRGDRILFFMTENRGVVESSSSKRVTATIYPEEEKK